MPDIIQLLPDAIANQIAAGEVVQRPASVVKELLENAIDAGASNITVVIKEAGKILIQVVDDGRGMSETDARMSLERHATSKIQSANDLFALRTMGFRGEALASIAAVAHVDIKTREADAALGTHIVVEGSTVKNQDPVATPAGTVISVKNLFYNVPARRNFLKSNPVEMRHIVDEIQRVALANHEVSFKVWQNDIELYQLAGGKLSQRIVHLFGKHYREQLVSCAEETEHLKITGYLGKPAHAKKTRGEQFFFVNKRFIKSPYLNHAVHNAYEGLLPEGHHAFYVLFIELDPKHIDVNVHPTKTEIKFDDERTVYGIVQAAARQALGRHNITPSLDFELNVNFEQQWKKGPNLPPEQGGHPAERTSLQERQYGQFKNLDAPSEGAYPAGAAESDSTRSGETRSGTQQPASNFYKSGPKGANRWQPLYEGLESPQPDSTTTPGGTNSWHPDQPPTPVAEGPAPVGLPAAEGAEEVQTFQSAANRGAQGSGALVNDQAPATPEKVIFQIHRRYIATQVKSGIMLVDQHLAHLRILFEKYSAMQESGQGACQQLLFPITLALNPADFSLVMDMKDEIEALGFQFAEFGQQSILIQGIPADLAQGHEKALFEGLIEQYKHSAAVLSLSREQKLARALAARSALKWGRLLNGQEMQNLIDQLFACQQPNYAPDGAATFCIITLDELSAFFHKE